VYIAGHAYFPGFLKLFLKKVRMVSPSLFPGFPLLFLKKMYIAEVVDFPGFRRKSEKINIWNKALKFRISKLKTFSPGI
jgi:hypothetical protein